MLQGLVSGKRVSVLRDSGANVTGVRRSLVMPDQFLGRSQAVRTFGSQVEIYLLVAVEVDISPFSCILECCVLEDPVADLTVGTWISVVQEKVECCTASTGLFLGVVENGQNRQSADHTLDCSGTSKVASHKKLKRRWCLLSHLLWITCLLIRMDLLSFKRKISLWLICFSWRKWV